MYKDARQFRQEIISKILPKIPKLEQYELGSQIRRAVTSIVLNIAEGSYRRSDKDFGKFLNQAITSLYEIVACLDILRDDARIEDDLYQYFLQKSDNLVKQLSAFDRSLSK